MISKSEYLGFGNSAPRILFKYELGVNENET